MKIGKIPESILKRQVFKQLGSERVEVLIGSGVGEDCAAIVVDEDETVVLSTDPITGTSKDIGNLAITVTLNDIASSGAEPFGVLVTILLPPESDEKELSVIMEDIDKACKESKVSVVGGHTEVTDIVRKPLISVTGVGKAKKNKLISTAGAKPGMGLLVTKSIGLEGTAIIAKEKEKELLSYFPKHMVEQAKDLDNSISVVNDGMIAAQNGAKAMHDITEGGILGALWEMAEASGIGLEIDMAKIPVLQETIEICEFYDINPYKLISSGSMLIAANDIENIQKALKDKGIDSSYIGKCTAGADRVVFYDENTLFLTPPSTDELYKVI